LFNLTSFRLRGNNESISDSLSRFCFDVMVDWMEMKNRNVFGLMLGLVSASMWFTAGLAQAQAISDGLGSVSHEEIRQELEGVPANVRAQMNREQMTRYITNLMLDRRLAEAARKAGTADLPQVRASIARATRDIVVRAYIDGEMAKAAAGVPDVTELARERYMANLGVYVVPEAIRVAHILFAVNDEDETKRDAVVKAKAMQVLKELRAGADFSELAKAHSEDPGSKREGGEIRGWSDKGRFVPPFEEAAYALKPGEISELVRTRFGYHIIKLLEKREARQQTFEEVKGPLVTALRNEYLGRKRAELLKPYEGNKPIVLDDATLEALKKP
jgi:peptidyl-prolyl cis-trans isomerase C